MRTRDFGPPPRDELATWSTAPQAVSTLAPIPSLAAASPPGSTLTVGGQDLFVRTTAGAGSGRDTWYIHGLDGASQNWNRLAGALVEYGSGYAPDLPGSGRSGPPRDGDYSVIGESDLVAQAIRQVSGGPVHLVGNSRGGVVATFLAARHPELVSDLTLVSPAVPDLRMVRDRGADLRLALLMLPGTAGLAIRQLDSLGPQDRAVGLALTCFGEPEALGQQDLDAAVSEFEARAERPWMALATVESLRSLMRSYLRPGRWSYWAAAARVAVPTLVVWGTRDRLVDARLSRRTAAAFADSRLLILPRTGHVAQMERPAEVASAMVAMWRSLGAPDVADTRVMAP